MPNFFSAFTSEVFRPLATLLIPGAIGISTWFIALLWHFPVLRTLVSNNHAEAGLILFMAMIFAGLVFDDLGSRVESYWDDCANHHDAKHLDNWFAYLRTCFKADPIGRRYVRTLVLHLKFELGTAFAMLTAALGLIWLWFMGLGCGVTFFTEAVCMVFIAWGFVEGRETHKALAKNRANLLQEIRIIDSKTSA